MKKLMIDGDISRWNESIMEFKKEMMTIDQEEDLVIEINSYGGDAFLGTQLGNLIAGHPGKTTAIVTGMAASAATLPVFACDEIKMFPSSQIMIHNPATLAYGDAKHLRKQADNLDVTKQAVVEVYSNRLEVEKAIKFMDEETYLNAAMAEKEGIVDEIIKGKVKPVKSEIFVEQAMSFNKQNIVEETDNDKQNQKLIEQMQQELLLEEIKQTL
ncbi:head maturation protease, ClpP-related [uncultured Vagococcus sp.]|uniref:head maturation protease, ClpP-related n=1 Tax=uncultured Vagococcus sp. TaxID=189676 RepID=UPI0025901B68|nr:head maturation protease, ClpP-related [uncultured Vagococcus sp.]